MATLNDKTKIKLMIYDLDQIVPVCNQGELFLRNVLQNQIVVLNRDSENNIGYSIVISEDGKILYLDQDDKIPFWCKNNAETLLNGRNHCVVPGLIDAHTHPIWFGESYFEFDVKSKDPSFNYSNEKQERIFSIVEQTKNATYSELKKRFSQIIYKMNKCGTTTIECKTSFGLTFENELKLLQILNQSKYELKNQMDIIITLLGTCTLPEKMNSEQGVSEVLSIMHKLQEEDHKLEIDFVDVVCEKEIYNLEQARRMLLTGRCLFNAKLSVHDEKLDHIGIGEYAKDLDLHSISHGQNLTIKALVSMSRKPTCLIICPNKVHMLKLNCPPSRQAINLNVPVALGSDFSPGIFCYSMPMTMHLAVTNCNFTINEAFAAASINAAFALGCSDRLGSLEVGKQGDLLVLNSNDYQNLIYRFGDTQDLIKYTIKKGNILT